MKKVVIVVNRADLGADLNRLFALNGDKAFTVTSGVEAINIMLNLAIDLVICETELEYGDGHWLMMQSRALKKIPKFIVVSEDEIVDIQKFLAAGATGIYHQPIIAEELFKFVFGFL